MQFVKLASPTRVDGNPGVHPAAELHYIAIVSAKKALIERYIEALSGHPKPSSLVQNYVADASLAQHIAEAEETFPRYEIVVEDMLAERDRVVIRGTFRGVHQGTFAGIPATGRAVSAGLMIIYRVANERIVEHWMELDRLALLQQLQSAAATANQ